ncbi:MAG: hypothetical protein ACYC6N_16055 [Pirellulaceae bacterium]
MVARLYSVACGGVGILLGQPERMPLMRLPPAARAKLIGALILLTIAGVALIVLSWLALRMGRRFLNRSDDLAAQRSRPVPGDDWADKPLVSRPPARPESDDV